MSFNPHVLISPLNFKHRQRGNNVRIPANGTRDGGTGQIKRTGSGIGIACFRYYFNLYIMDLSVFCSFFLTKYYICAKDITVNKIQIIVNDTYRITSWVMWWNVKES